MLADRTPPRLPILGLFELLTKLCLILSDTLPYVRLAYTLQQAYIEQRPRVACAADITFKNPCPEDLAHSQVVHYSR